MGFCIGNDRVGIDLRSESLILGQGEPGSIFAYQAEGCADSVEITYEYILAALNCLADPENREAVRRRFPQVLEKLKIESEETE